MRDMLDKSTPAINAPASLRVRLQRSTQTLHLKLEHDLDLQGRAWTRPTYLALLKRLWGLYSPLEQRLSQLDWEDSGILFAQRRKVAWLEHDLVYLGVQPSCIPGLEQCGHLPPIETLASGMGALYVLEGATLGGQLILKVLEQQIGIFPGAGGRFYASYGSDIGAMWRKYLQALEKIGAHRDPAKIEEGAILTFKAFDRWLEDWWNAERSNA